ncbi:MAG: hypothetical protein IKY33_04040 [Clostridia bacterium]|nr:hypothetical protein [Clostridia bacterium]
MKLQYLGTAAAEGIPAIFCTCETCRLARKTGGKNIRTRSQALIDDQLMIDFPADTYLHCTAHGIDLTNIHHYLITHTHADHLYPMDLHMLRRGFANLPADHPPYHFWGGKEMVEMLQPYVDIDRMDGRLILHELTIGVPTMVGEHLVTAFPAQHGTVSPYIYLIERNGKSLLYANDTGALLPDVWDYLFKARQHLSAVSMDCTHGNKLVTKEGAGHMGFVNIQEICATLEQKGHIDFLTKRIVNHFSHNHPQVNYTDHAVYEDKGYIMSYDGLVVEI